MLTFVLTLLHDFDPNRLEKSNHVNGNGQILIRNKTRKRRHLGRMGNIKKAQNHEYHVSEETRETMNVGKRKRSNEDQNWLHPNKQARHRHKFRCLTVINQVNTESDHRIVMSNIKLDVEVGKTKKIDSRRYTN